MSRFEWRFPFWNRSSGFGGVVFTSRGPVCVQKKERKKERRSKKNFWSCKSKVRNFFEKSFGQLQTSEQICKNINNTNNRCTSIQPKRMSLMSARGGRWGEEEWRWSVFFPRWRRTTISNLLPKFWSYNQTVRGCWSGPLLIINKMEPLIGLLYIETSNQSIFWS